jgi:hypothetical protein
MGNIVRWFGYAVGFLYLAAIALCASCFPALWMPEAKDAAQPGQPDTAQPHAADPAGQPAAGPGPA